MALSETTKDKLTRAASITAAVLNAVSEQPNYRSGQGITNRNEQVMTWQLPNGAYVQMYINPENFVVNESKQITQTRTKGGFVVQYWGDNLTRLTLSGTTGSAGIRGIQVLRDIYHSENRTFELVASAQTNELFTVGTDLEDQSAQIVPQMAKTLRERNFILRPSLASLAVGVTLFYQGIRYRGFFTEFSMTESIQKLGLFDYNMVFMVTETRGTRKNFMPWHREPTADDPSGQLFNAFVSSAGNAIRGAFGLSPQQSPTELHPENAPLTFGGDSVASMLGMEATGPAGNATLR